jgi:hypothetical protein
MRLRLTTAMAAALLLRVATALPAQATKSGDDGLTLFSKPSYGGQQATLRGDTPDLGAVGTHDVVSSLRIRDRERWEICDERSYTGHCATLSRSEPDLALRGWNDRVASARRVYGTDVSTPGYSSSGIELFSEPLFRGSSTTITDVRTTLPDSASRVGSIRVRAGTWELCDLARFAGRCVLVEGELPELRSTGLGDHVGSLRLHVSLRRLR